VTRVAIKDGLFEPLDDEGRLRLIGGLCNDCERRHFPSQDTCPYCGAGDCRRAALSRSGIVRLCTSVISRPPGYDGPVPYGFGVIDLADGIRVIARLVDPETAVGAAVELTVAPVGTDEEGREIVTYAFQSTGSRLPATGH
jgi:uncharacterized OB-fold protein